MIDDLPPGMSDGDKENINKSRFEIVQEQIAALEKRTTGLEEKSDRNYDAVLAGNQDVAKILVWVHGAQTGVKYGHILVSFFGKFVLMLGKYAAGFAILWALYDIIKHGKPFNWHDFYSKDP